MHDPSWNGQDALPIDVAAIREVPADALQRLRATAEAAAGGPSDPSRAGALGFTMFDAPNSQDNLVTVLLNADRISRAPSQALVRIRSDDARSYVGTVVAGPFAEPDGLRADSSVLVTVVTRGGIFVPPYHGRVQVEIMGEEREGGLVPPRFRPLPNSPVFLLDQHEMAAALRIEGDIRLGQVIGQEDLAVAVPSWRKDVLPRHLAILGTTGGGKSTTVAGLIHQAQAAGCAVILLDVEGEYTFLHEPTEDPAMRAALDRRGIAPEGVPNIRLLHLVGRETANPAHPASAAFSLQFARPSPYALAEMMQLSEAQHERFMQAYEVAQALLRELNIFPKQGNAEQEQLALEIDEFERGYPRMELHFLMDVVAAALAKVEKEDPAKLSPRHPALSEHKDALVRRIGAAQLSASPISWRALLGRLASLNRLRVFDRPDRDARPLSYAELLRPGRVTIVDLSDSGSPVLNNIVIADLLRGIQEAQDAAYEAYERAQRSGEAAEQPARALIVIEEAHEFLSGERADKMPVLFEQVARISRRGRKRWLGLVFVTQLPQHLPRQLFGLVNSYVLHKIADPAVVSTLQRTVSGIDESLWRRLPGLAPGQAIVAFPHLARPLLVAIDPAPARLRLVD
ncbi:MAG TPA: ATP-binding protein [Chloroflexota bacterium]|nr:ATP-binding protein [Chloroflexota bacterium]